MSKYTFELREVISTFGEDEVKSWFMDYELSDFLTPEQVNVINSHGVFSKKALADRIVDHYFTREIGTDAIGQFRLFIKDSMHEIMESYAPVVYSAALSFDPLLDTEYTETYTGINENTSDTTSDANSKGVSIDSDTPQGRINKNDILEGKYASSTSASDTDSNSKTVSNGTGKQDYTRNMKGANRSKAELIRDYRAIIRAINTEIVYKLEPLFMGLY